MEALRLPESAGAASADAAERPAGLLLAAWWRTVLKHKWGIAGLAVALALLSALVAYSLEPVYRARTTLLVDTGQQRLSPVADDVTGGWMSYLSRQNFLQTQILLIRSRALATTVAERLDLWTEPGLDPRREAPRRARLQLDLRHWLPWPAPAEQPEITAEAARSAVVARVQAGVDAELLPDSDIIEIRWTGDDPDLAARIANAYADSYIELGLETRLEQARRAASWLTDRLGGLREKLKASEHALQQYRDSHGLLAAEGTPDLTDQELAGLSGQLIDARADYDRLAALVVQARGIESVQGAGLAAHPTVAGNAVIQALKAEEVAAEREVQELAKRYGNQHPRMVAAREDLRTVRAKLRAEVGNVVAALTKERDIAAGRVKQLEQALAEAKSTARKSDRQAFQLRALERDVQANRQLYDLFLTRFKETDLGTDLESTDARVIDAARPPAVPIKPHKTRIVLVTVLLGGMLGIGIAFLLEHLDNTLKTGEDIEERLGLTMLGSLPLLRGRSRRRAPERMLLERPNSEFAEAVRTIRTGLVLSGVDDPHRRVLITSTVPEEGKTTLAIGLALALASLERVLLIDADMRRASLGTRLGLDKDARGLSDLVAGEAAQADCIVHLEEAGLDLLPAGAIPPNPLELLSSRRFAETLAAVAADYDRVIIDAAPAQAVSDPLVLSQHCDAVIYVVRADATPLPLVEIAVKRLRQVSAPLIGAVLNQFDHVRSARYGHYQYGRYRRYSYAYGGYSDYAGKGKPRRT